MQQFYFKQMQFRIQNITKQLSYTANYFSGYEDTFIADFQCGCGSSNALSLS